MHEAEAAARGRANPIVEVEMCMDIAIGELTTCFWSKTSFWPCDMSMLNLKEQPSK